MKKVLVVPMILALLLTAVASVACAKKEGGLPTYAAGNQWVYKWVEDTDECTLTQQVIGEEVVEGKDCYAMDWSWEPPMHGTMSTMGYWVDKETLNLFSKMQASYEYQGQSVTWTTVSVYEFLEGSYWPLKVGQEFKLEGTETTTAKVGGQVVSSEDTTRTLIGEVEKKEEIEVLAGKFDCFKIVTTDEDGNLVYRSWYSDDVKGTVKSISYDEDENVTRTMELKSYSL